MQLTNRPQPEGPMQGAYWVKTAFLAMRKEPLTLMVAVMFYLFMMAFLSNLMNFGVILANLFCPFGLVFMARVTEDALQKKRVGFAHLFSLFKDKHLRLSLFILGVLYAVINAVLSYIYSWWAGDQLYAWSQSLQNNSEMLLAPFANFPVTETAIILVLYTIFNLMIWFAPLLVVRREMPVAKALFFSIMGTLRSVMSFVVLGITLFLISGAYAAVCMMLLSIFTDSIAGIMFLTSFMSLIFLTLIYATYWPAYLGIFEYDRRDPEDPLENKSSMTDTHTNIDNGDYTHLGR